MFEGLNDLTKSQVVGAVHYAIGLIKHKVGSGQAELRLRGEGTATEPSSPEWTGLQLVSEIEQAEEISIHLLSKEKADEYISILADIILNRPAEVIKLSHEPPPLLIDELEADATVPQCLDSQYISDGVFQLMVSKGFDYSHPQVRTMRAEDTGKELIRSLVYSSQVIINRHSFLNNEFLYRHYLPENKKDLAAFADLLSGNVIVPYLRQRRSFADEYGGDIYTAGGGQALKALLDRTGGNFTSVRLAEEDNENDKMLRNLLRRFGGYLSELRFIEDDQLKEMAIELFDPRRLPLETEDLEAFKRQIWRLADYATERIGELTRQQIYRDWFAKGVSDQERDFNASVGRFREPDESNPFLFELKKLVDLRYNSNLPDFLGRTTFTPYGMPSRGALQDFQEALYESKGRLPARVLDRFVDESLDQFKQIKPVFDAQAQKAMYVPKLGRLSVADAAAIRRLPAWGEFSMAQRAILSNPLEILDRLEDFQRKVDAFQEAMAGWYNIVHSDQGMEKRYANYVTIALQVAGQTLVFGADFFGQQARVRAGAVDLMGGYQSSKGYMVELRVNVIDLKTMDLDEDRSYSIELMRTNTELTIEDVKTFVSRSKGIGGDQVRHSDASQIAALGR